MAQLKGKGASLLLEEHRFCFCRMHHNHLSTSHMHHTLTLRVTHLLHESGRAGSIWCIAPPFTTSLTTLFFLSFPYKSLGPSIHHVFYDSLQVSQWTPCLYASPHLQILPNKCDLQQCKSIPNHQTPAVKFSGITFLLHTGHLREHDIKGCHQCALCLPHQFYHLLVSPSQAVQHFLHFL